MNKCCLSDYEWICDHWKLAAAVGAVEAIRRVNHSIPITMISDEPHSVYSRPLISHLLSGELKADRMYYRPKDFYEKNRTRALLEGV